MLLIMLVVLNRDYREIVALLCEKRDRRLIRNKSRTKSIRLNRALMRQLEYDSKEEFFFFSLRRRDVSIKRSPVRLSPRLLIYFAFEERFAA